MSHMMLHFKSPSGEVFAYETLSDRAAYGSADLVLMSEAEVAQHLNPPPTQEEIQASFTASIQARLDAFARTRGYDGILSACTYATSVVPRFQQEGQRAVELRDATWNAAYAILDEVLAQQRPMPTSIADIEQDLPVLGWLS